MAEAYVGCGGRGQGDPGASFCWPGGGFEAPGAGYPGPFGGQGDVAGDGLGEVVGGVAGEPSVEQVAVPGRVLGPGGLSAAGDALGGRSGSAVGVVEGDGVGCACLGLAVGRLALDAGVAGLLGRGLGCGEGGCGVQGRG